MPRKHYVLTKVQLKEGTDNSLLKQALTTHRNNARFGETTHNPFFSRNMQHSIKTRRLKGINDKLICAVNDITFGRGSQFCPGRVLTSKKCLVLQDKLPTAAIGTNLPTDVPIDLPFLTFEQTDSPHPRLLTIAWQSELYDLTEKVCRLQKAITVDSITYTPEGSHKPDNIGIKDDEGTIKIQLKVINLLSQILQAKSTEQVQQWLLTADQREKDHLLSLLCTALTKELSPASENPETVQLVVKQVYGQAQAPPTFCTIPTVPGEESRRNSGPLFELLSTINSAAKSHSERPSSRMQKGNYSPTPSAMHRQKGSRTVCHLNQKVVVRYTKKALPPPTSC